MLTKSGSKRQMRVCVWRSRDGDVAASVRRDHRSSPRLRARRSPACRYCRANRGSPVDISSSDNPRRGMQGRHLGRSGRHPMVASPSRGSAARIQLGSAGLRLTPRLCGIDVFCSSRCWSTSFGGVVARRYRSASLAVCFPSDEFGDRLGRGVRGRECQRMC